MAMPLTERPSRPVLSVVAVGAAVALSLFGDMAMYVILPLHYVDLGLTALQVGILLSANRWVRLITNRVAERLIRRHGSTVLFPGALILGSSLAAAYSTAPAFVVLLALRMVWGFCWSVIRHTGVMTTIGVAGPGRTGRFMGIYVAMLQGGFVAGTFVAGLLFDAGGFRNALLLGAAMSLAAVPTALFAGRRSHVSLRDQPPHTGDEPRAVDAARTGDATEPSNASDPPGPADSRLANLLLGARGFIVSLVGAGLIMSTLGYILKSRFGDTVSLGTLALGVATVNGALLAAQYLINGIGSPLLGMLIDRHGLRLTGMIGFAAAGITLLSLGLFGSPAVLVPLVIVFFVSGAISRLAVESEAAGKGSRAYAGLATATDLGSAVGPVLGWVGIEIAQSHVVFWAGGALLLAGAVLTAFGASPRFGAPAGATPGAER